MPPTTDGAASPADGTDAARRPSSTRRGRFARLHGDLWRDPTWAALPLSAVGLWARLLSYGADQKCDGVVPLVFVSALANGAWPEAELAALERVGALTVGAESIRVAWQAQLSRDDWDAVTVAARERQARRRRARDSEDGGPRPRDSETPRPKRGAR